MNIRAAVLGVGFIFAGVLGFWLAGSCGDSEHRVRADALEDTVRIHRDSLKVLKDTLTLAKERTDSAEAVMQALRERAERDIEWEREVQRDSEIRFASAGETLMATLDSIAFVAPELQPLVNDAKMQVHERDREHESVVESLEAQMQSMVDLQESTDSVRVACSRQALSCDLALEQAEEALRAQTDRVDELEQELDPGLTGWLKKDLPKGLAWAGLGALIALVVK